jgi:hypothetical protein
MHAQAPRCDLTGAAQTQKSFFFFFFRKRRFFSFSKEKQPKRRLDP